MVDVGKIFFFILLLTVQTLFGQGKINYNIQVVNDAGEPFEGYTVTATETSTLQQNSAKTNALGQAFLALQNGNEWVVDIEQIKQANRLSAAPYTIADMHDVYVYNLQAYKRKQSQNFTRTNDGFKIVHQNLKSDAAIPAGHCMVALTLKHPITKNLLYDITVQLVNLKNTTIYKASTNSNGLAVLVVPNKSNYDIDIAALKNYGHVDFGDEYLKQSIEVFFAPSKVNEKIVADTVYQQATKQTMPSSERALVKIKVNGGKRNGKNETVYLRSLKSGKVYTTKADATGLAIFLVPIHEVYMVDFRYQKNSDAINLKNAKGMTEAAYEITYQPNPKLEYPERFIPTSENLLLKKYQSFLTTQFEKPVKKPFLLNIKSVLKINKQSREALFTLKLSGSEQYGKGVRLPANIAFVLDKSGSMYSDDRSEALKRALWDLGSTLTERDNVLVVLFDNSAVKVQDTHKEHLVGFERIIANYQPAGGTNIFSGLQLASDALLSKNSDATSSRIVLLTDGYGITPVNEITDFVTAKNKEGIDFSTIGLGYYYNQYLLQLIADKGNGTYAGVENTEQLSDALLKEVKSALNYVVKDLKIEISYDNKMLFSSLTGYPVSNQTKNSIAFEIKKLPQTVNEIGFLKFKLNQPNSTIEQKPLMVKVSYIDLVQNKQVNYTETIELEWTNETDLELQMNQEEQKLYAISVMNQSLKLMAQANDNNDIKAAKTALNSGINQIKAMFPAAKPSEVKTLFNELNGYFDLFKRMEMNGEF